MAMSPQVKMLAVLIVILLALAIGIFAMMDTGLCHRNQFASGGEPGARDLIEKGWLPEWFPEGATDVREAHSVDSNRAIVRFALDAAQVDAMTSGAKAVTRSAHEIDVPPGECSVDWWESASLLEGINEGSVVLYERPHQRIPGVWIIAHREPEVWMWNVPGARDVSRD